MVESVLAVFHPSGIRLSFFDGLKSPRDKLDRFIILIHGVVLDPGDQLDKLMLCH